MAHGDQHGLWNKVSDQDMLLSYYGRSITALPPAWNWNWKPYWGLPQDLLWSTPEPVHLLHFHGPKTSIVLCCFNRWRALDCLDLAAVPGAFEAALKEMNEKDTVCGGRSSVEEFMAACEVRNRKDVQLFLVAGKNGAQGVYESMQQELEESLEGIKQELCGSSGGAAGAAGVPMA